MKLPKSITQRIREYYCSDDNDEWLVERGKVKEGRLLKEACIELERLEEANITLSRKNSELYYKDVLNRSEIIKPYKEKIYEFEVKFNRIKRHLDNFVYSYGNTLTHMESIRDEIKNKDKEED